MDVQNPVRRGIFVLVDNQEKKWVAFKYKSLPTFCFGCERMGLGVNNCDLLTKEEKERPIDNLPYLIELRVESKLVGKESLVFDFAKDKSKKQSQYSRGVKRKRVDFSCFGEEITSERNSAVKKRLSEKLEEVESGGIRHDLAGKTKRSSWKRLVREGKVVVIDHVCEGGKQKLLEADDVFDVNGKIGGFECKRAKDMEKRNKDGQMVKDRICNLELCSAPFNIVSVATKKVVDQEQ